MKNKLQKQIVKFSLVGVLNTLISYVIYVAALACGLPYIVGSLLGFFVSVFHAWVWQYFVIFKEESTQSDRVWWRSLLKTYTSYAATGLILQNALLFGLLDVVHYESIFSGFFSNGSFLIFSSARELAEYSAPFLLLIITVPLNFILNKYWAFGEKKTDSM